MLSSKIANVALCFMVCTTCVETHHHIRVAIGRWAMRLVDKVNKLSLVLNCVEGEGGCNFSGVVVLGDTYISIT